MHHSVYTIKLQNNEYIISYISPFTYFYTFLAQFGQGALQL